MLNLTLLTLFWLRGAITFDFTSTLSALEDASSPYLDSLIGREGSECYGNQSRKTFAKERSADFLNMVNFMEFTQATSTGRSEDFMIHYELAKASMEHGNTFMAQEHMARALKAVEGSGRRKRSADWTAAGLFNQFRATMGEERLKKLLHLDKRVVMSFVIDTSSSMANDMAQVHEYIGQLVTEQQTSGVQVEYCVTTFADPLAYKTETFHTRSALFRKLKSLRPSIGGDCEEKTCSGIKTALLSTSSFWTVHNSAMYIFTDASSKDCVREFMQIGRTLKMFKASAFFILFGSCKPNTIDRYYVSLAQKSGGFALLVKNSGIYNITDTVNGAFDKEALVYGEESDNTRSVVGQGVHGLRHKREVSEVEERTVLIDTSIERFKVIITATPTSVLSQVKLETPADGDNQLCGKLPSGRENVIQKSSIADNSVIIDVSTLSCPCTGRWKLSYPREAVTFDYKVHSSGNFLVEFEAYFVDKVGSYEISNRSPCIGIKENLVIKLNQGEKVNRETLTVRIIGVSGRVTFWKESLKDADQGNNAFVTSLVLPSNIGPEGFVILLEGELVNGVPFQRTSPTQFFPTGSCLRTVLVTNHYSLMPGKSTLVKVAITNNKEYPDSYLLTCDNSMNYDVSVGIGSLIKSPSGERRGRSNPVLLYSEETAFFFTKIIVPRDQNLQRGRPVLVSCKVTTASEDLLEMVVLTEVEVRL